MRQRVDDRLTAIGSLTEGSNIEGTYHTPALNSRSQLDVKVLPLCSLLDYHVFNTTDSKMEQHLHEWSSGPWPLMFESHSEGSIVQYPFYIGSAPEIRFMLHQVHTVLNEEDYQPHG